MSKHSPGPWQIAGDSFVVDADGQHIVDMLGTPDDQRLIAAAPELLELVRRYLEGPEIEAAIDQDAEKLLARIEDDS